MISAMTVCQSYMFCRAQMNQHLMERTFPIHIHHDYMFLGYSGMIFIGITQKKEIYSLQNY